MSNDRLPKSDLVKLQEEILALPPSAALPCNLPDYWLDMIARDLEATLTEGKEGYAAAPLILITHLVQGKTSATPEEGVQIPLDRLFAYFCDLRVEINLEIVSRRRRCWVEPATLDSIFTNRMVSVVRGAPSSSSS